MIQTLQLRPGITLRCFRDERFKHACLSVQLVRPMRAQEAAKNALLPAVLLRGCESCPDMRAITLHLDDLYGASVGTLARRVGDWQVSGIGCSFVEDRFAMAGDAILQPMAAFAMELMLRPVLENGVFSNAFVESEKVNLIAVIEAQRNDKRGYALDQLLAYLCSNDAFGLPRLGEVHQVAEITAADLYAHYQTILRESPMEIFYVGSEQPETVAAILTPLVENLPRQYVPLPAQSPFGGGETGEFTERMDVAQGKLCMGFVTPTTVNDAEFAAMQVCNTIFGGGMTSKLFQQVREKQSLCYAIGSGYYSTKGIVTVTAGIDFDKKEDVQQQVCRQAAAMAAGEITDEELTAAKEALRASLQSTHDSPGSIEGYYSTSILSGNDRDPESYLRQVEAVTAQDVAREASKMALRTVFFLQGVEK